MKILGSHGASQRFPGAQGIGVTQQRGDPTWVGAVGKTGEVKVIPAGAFHGGGVQVGYAFQAVGGSVKVAFSCADPTLATTAGFSADADYWCNEVTVAPGAITFVSDILFTLVRLTFVAAAEIYIVAR